MKNVKLLVIFGMIVSFAGMNASDNKFEECLRLKENLVQALSRVDAKDREDYMTFNNSMFNKAFHSCQIVKPSSGNGIERDGDIFRKELHRNLSNKFTMQATCTDIRKQFAAALSVITNDIAAKGIIDAYASDLAGCK